MMSKLLQTLSAAVLACSVCTASAAAPALKKFDGDWVAVIAGTADQSTALETLCNNGMDLYQLYQGDNFAGDVLTLRVNTAKKQAVLAAASSDAGVFDPVIDRIRLKNADTLHLVNSKQDYAYSDDHTLLSDKKWLLRSCRNWKTTKP